MSSSLKNLFNYSFSLAESKADVPENLPCKPEILALRECATSGKKSKCTLPALDLSTCQAAYEVEVNDRVRKSIGIAAYNEYVKEMEDKHGKEEADRLINVPKENLKNLQALQTVVRFGSGQHPKGSTPDESWSVTDYNRLNMGEEEYKAHRLIVAAEFGGEKAAKVLGEETDLMINDAIKRISAINA